MLQFPKKVPVSKFEGLFKKIDILVSTCQYLPLSEVNKEKLYHFQTLKSSLFSARIEGNKLTLSQVKEADFKDSKEKNKLELNNILLAHDFLKNKERVFARDLVLKTHGLVMKDLSPRAGKFRHEASAIFDGLGNMVYLTPSPDEMEKMFDVWKSNSDKVFEGEFSWQEALINTLFCHYYFEKIHPFFDGNGRVGRLLLKRQLQKIGFFNDLVFPIEEYFAENRSEYYYFLEKNTSKQDGFVEFFLKGIVWSLERFLQDVKEENGLGEKTKSKGLGLLPRREEILNIIKDHPFISLDSIARRFPIIPRRTISHDVKKLLERELIERHGQTRGACYSVRES